MRVAFKMNPITYALLALLCVVAVAIPFRIGPRTTLALPKAGPTMMRVHGVVRDFKSGHPDFGVTPSAGNGHYAGNVQTALGPGGRPVFVGGTGGAVTDFQITGGSTVPTVDYVPMITVIGSNMDTGSYLMPVTVKLHIGDASFEPFGSLASPMLGNVDTKTGNPRKYVHAYTVPAKTPIHAESTSWSRKSGATGTKDTDFTKHMTISSNPSTAQVKVLRNGDTAPSVAGFGTQASAAAYLKDFIDPTTKKVTLQSNQTIYLFELYTTNFNDAAADFQDLVLLVTLGDSAAYLNTLDAYGKQTTTAGSGKGYKVAGQWKDSQGNNIAPHLFGSAANDVAGSKGTSSTGGIKSGDTFDQWFSDALGMNLSGMYDIVLTKNTQGVWEYITNEFFPAEDVLYGNEGAAHNYLFTYTIAASFTHHAGEHRFVEFSGADDAWVFADGKLGIDLGGVIPDKTQYLDVDRLGLSDGQKYTLHLFFAQRNTNLSAFRLRTNLDLGQDSTPYTITGIGD